MASHGRSLGRRLLRNVRYGRRAARVSEAQLWAWISGLGAPEDRPVHGDLPARGAVDWIFIGGDRELMFDPSPRHERPSPRGA